MTRNEFDLFIPEEDPVKSRIPTITANERTVQELMAALCIAWGTLSPGQQLGMEKDETKRNILARVQMQEEWGRIFMDIRRVFDIPEMVRVQDFPTWLGEWAVRQRREWEAKWNEKAQRCQQPAQGLLATTVVEAGGALTVTDAEDGRLSATD